MEKVIKFKKGKLGER